MIPFILAFMVCGVLNWGYTYVLGFVLIVVCYPLLKRQNIKINFILEPSFWILGAFGLTYVVFGGISSDAIQNDLILPLVAYVIGWCSFEQGGKDSVASKNNILGITSGLALHAALNYLVNAGNTNRGLLIDFWSGSYWSATGSGFLNTMIFSLLVYFVVIEQRRWVKLSFGILTVFCTLYMLMLGNRTQLIILGVAVAGVGVIYLMERRRWDSLAKTFVGVCLLITALIICYRFNIFGLADLIDSSNLVARFIEKSEMSKSNSERVYQFWAGIKNLYQHPFGGQKSQMYFHNMWLDISRVAGIIPMVLMLLYNGITLQHTVQLFRNKQIDIATRYVALSVYIGCLMNFCVEPVLDGLVSFFLSFCIINGITDSMNFHNEMFLENESLRSEVL